MRVVFASLSSGNAHAGKAVHMSAVGVKYINPQMTFLLGFAFGVVITAFFIGSQHIKRW
jgi:hypothetical protein